MATVCGFGDSDFTIEDSMYNPVTCDGCDRSVELDDARRGPGSPLMYCKECWADADES